jgi:hypothetical protein
VMVEDEWERMGRGSLAREKGMNSRLRRLSGVADSHGALAALFFAREMDELRFFPRRGTRGGGGGSKEYRPPVLLAGQPDRWIACASQVARPRPGAWRAAPRERPHGRGAPCAGSGGDATGVTRSTTA